MCYIGRLELAPRVHMDVIEMYNKKHKGVTSHSNSRLSFKVYVRLLGFKLRLRFKFIFKVLQIRFKFFGFLKI
jgi:hypothetical protein